MQKEIDNKFKFMELSYVTDSHRIDFFVRHMIIEENTETRWILKLRLQYAAYTTY